MAHQTDSAIAQLLQQGEDEFHQGHLDTARELFTQALQKDSGNVDARNNLAVIACEAGELSDAESLLLETLAMHPESADTHLNYCALVAKLALKAVPVSIRTKQLLSSLEWLARKMPDPSRDTLLRENEALRKKALDDFIDRYHGCGYRILLHRPSNGALKYLMDSWAEALNFMGIRTHILNWGNNTQHACEMWEPDLFITVADKSYVEQCDWSYLSGLHRNGRISIAQIAPGVHKFAPCDFYVTWHLDPSRDERYANLDRPIVSVPFGANPLQHYMRPGLELFDYFFVGTNSHLKEHTTNALLAPILESYDGLLAGDRWPGGLGELSVMQAAGMYRFARVYPNYHLPTQYDRFDEINERTYVIPACGGFEIVDKPLAISEMFAPDEMVVADSPDDYAAKFSHYLNAPDERAEYVARGMRRVFKEYTLFHRLTHLLEFVGVKAGV